MSKILLIDGHSILNRAFYGVPDLTNSKGIHTNAVYGFLNIMLKVMDEEKPDHMTVAFDVKHPTFRHKMYEAYKGTRKPMPAELHEQVPVIKEVLKAMNICVVERPGYEADDIIGTIAGISEDQGYDVTILSGDRDLLQLVTNKVTLRIPKTKGGKTEVIDYTPAKVKEDYQLLPKQIIDLKGLMGDSSDNIPGLPGVGKKTATNLLLQYETVENVIAHAEEVKPKKAREALVCHPELATMSKELATIKVDCELDYDINDALVEDMFNSGSYRYIKDLEFKSLLAKFDASCKAVDEKPVEYEVIADKNVLDKLYNTISHRDNTDDFAAVHFLWNDTGRVKEEELTLFNVGMAENDEYVLDGMIFYGCGQEKAYVFMNWGSSFDDDIRKFIDDLLKEKVDVSMYDVKRALKFLNFSYRRGLYDAGVAAYLLNPLKDSYDPDDIARDYLDKNIPSFAEKFGKSKSGELLEEKNDEYIEYSALVCQILYKGIKTMTDRLKGEDMFKLYTDIEMPLIFTLNNMEEAGIKVNKQELHEYGESLTDRINELENEIYQRAGEEFNINSPKQLGVILFEKLKLPFAKKTKTGYSTSADILEKLRIEDPIVPAVLEYRQLTKLKSTYADGLAVYIKEDGRIHGKFNQTVTATGRISSTEPNLQNIPVRMELGRKIRKVFVPEDGCVFLDADYSQIELRVLADMSGDEALISAYNENMDVHATTAAKVFHVDIDEVTADLRRKAKAVNFGIVYGISSFGLGQDLHIPKKEAEEYIKRYFENYPKVKNFLDGLVEDAKKTGYSVTKFGRRRPVPELSSGNFMQRSFGERVAMNAPIQGTAADIIKIAMINVDKKLKEYNMRTRLILQVHDELLLEAPEDEIEMASRILNDEMVNAVNLKVKMVASVEKGSNWYEAK